MENVCGYTNLCRSQPGSDLNMVKQENNKYFLQHTLYLIFIRIIHMDLQDGYFLHGKDVLKY